MRKLFYIIFLMISQFLFAQTTINYALNNTNIYIAPTPTGGGFAPQSNYAATTKPLLAESYPTNFQPGVNSGTIHAGAGNINNVLFGGDLPSTGVAYGTSAVPVFTTQTFNQSDFPIYLECNFYSENGLALYNESYLTITPSNYQYFASPTTYVPQQTAQREGILFGGNPLDLKIFDHKSSTQATVVQSNPHNFASNGSWYNMKIILDEANGNLIIRSAKINNQSVITNQNLGQVTWLNSYRLGIAVDDLAEGFQFTTNYSTLIADFQMSDTSICVGECINLTNMSTTSFCTNCNTYQWSFTGANTVGSTQQNPTNICFPNAGTYPITLTVNNSVETETITKMITVKPLPLVNLGSDTILCNNQSLTLDATLANATYLWSNNSTNATLNVNNTGTYWVAATVNNCTARDTISVTSPPILTLELGNDTTLCSGETIFLDAIQPNVNYFWQDGSMNPTFNVTQVGNYFVSISNVCEVLSDTIAIQFTSTQLQVNLGNDIVLCIGESLILDVTNSTAESYLWQDGSTNSTFNLTQSGIYFVAVSDTCVTIMDTINVIFTGDFPMPNLGNDTVLCQGDELILDGFSPIANTYLWNDGSTNSTLTVNSGGQYIVTATNNCGSTNDTINIQLIISELAIDLGNDTTLCNGDDLLLDAFNTTALSYEWQDGSTNDNFLVIQTGVYKVTATDFCTVLSDSIAIEYLNLNIDLGNDTAICEGQIILLDAYHPNAENYTWQNGSKNSYFAIKEAGQYFVIVENHCETVSDTIEVTVSLQTPLVPNLGLNRFLCPGAMEILDASTENALTYVWQDSTEGAIYIVTEPGIYEVTISNACLSLTDDIEFTADACCNLFLPDAFTPNDDGINDIFYAFTNCQVNDFSMMIYDRWGGKLFETTDINTGWDGTTSGQTLNTGVYVYVLSFNDGFSTRKSEGSFTLIR
jgi:gliding motility-associated-like protein